MHVVRVVAVVLILALKMSLGYADDPPQPVILKGHDRAVTTVAWADDGTVRIAAVPEAK